MTKAIIPAPAQSAPAVVDPKEFGVNDETARKIEAQFLPMIAALSDLEKRYFEIIGTKADLRSKEIVAKARRLRLDYGEVRRLVAEIHKQQKAYFLNGGRFVDAFKNVQTFACTGREEALEEIEKAEEREREERRKQLQATRSDLLRGLVPDPDRLDLGNMAPDVFDAYLVARRKEHDDAVAAAQAAKEAADRQAAAEAAEKERLREENRKLREAAEAKAAEIALIERVREEEREAEAKAAEIAAAEIRKAQAAAMSAERALAKAEEEKDQAEQRSAAAEKAAEDVRRHVVDNMIMKPEYIQGAAITMTEANAALEILSAQPGAMIEPRSLNSPAEKSLDELVAEYAQKNAVKAQAAAIDFLEGREATPAELLAWVNSFRLTAPAPYGSRADQIAYRFTQFVEWARFHATTELELIEGAQ